MLTAPLAGTVAASGDVDGAVELSINAGAGGLTINGAVGRHTELSVLEADVAGDTLLHDVNAGRVRVMVGGGLDLAGDLAGTTSATMLLRGDAIDIAAGERILDRIQLH